MALGSEPGLGNGAGEPDCLARPDNMGVIPEGEPGPRGSDGEATLESTELAAPSTMEEEEEELGGDSDRELLLNDGMTRISEPQPLSLRQLLQLNVGWAGMFAISLAWNIVTVPSQVRSTAGDENAGKALSVMIAISAILVVFVTPWVADVAPRRLLFGP